MAQVQDVRSSADSSREPRTTRSAHLFTPLTVRSITLRNRIVVSPMCQYSCVNRDGMATPWHTVHLGGFAVGGAGLVFSEATAVEARGRISPEDLGIWDDAHIEPLASVTRFIRDQGAIPGIQLAHAGRKASVVRPWDGGGAVALDQGGWETVGPSAIPFADTYRAPRALSIEEIGQIRTAFVQAADRALAAGFQTIEIHAAHGYLLHEFLSPVSNHRTDAYGGSFENRIRLVLEVVRAVRQRWPEELPLFVRVSATDWLEDEPGIASWTLEQTVELARMLRDGGVDVLDCSSGGNVARAHVPAGPGYQTAFAERVRRESGLATMAVGMITEPAQADHIVRSGQADLVALARAFLREPHWAFLAAQELGQPQPWPPQYLRARLR